MNVTFSSGLFILAGTLVLAAPADRPNVLLIVTDDQRPDTIHALGNKYIETPNLDQLVSEGASFPRAIVAIPHCLPSRAEIMTGASGFRNGSPPFGEAINPGMTLWANVMKQAGYHTWYAGKWMNDGTPLTRGYEETRGMFAGAGGIKQPMTYPITKHNGYKVGAGKSVFFHADAQTHDLEKGIGRTPFTDRHIADAAIEFLQRRTDRPFFLHLNFAAPHDPRHIPPHLEGKYDPAAIPLPPNFLPQHPFDHGNAGQRDENLFPLPRTVEDMKTELAAYYAVVTGMDIQVGRVLGALRASGRYDNTVVIFTADHGLAVGSHGLVGKQNMYDHTIGVPLIMRGPRIPANRRFNAQTYLRDLYPTVCDLIGLAIPASVEGRSLMPVLSGQTQQIYLEVYAYWHRSEYSAELPVQRMVRTERWKLIYYSNVNRYQMFDLANDPFELRDLSHASQFRTEFDSLKGKLDAWFGPRIAPFKNAPKKKAKRASAENG